MATFDGGTEPKLMAAKDRQGVQTARKMPATVWPEIKTVESILQATGARFVPAGLDRNQLRIDLHELRVEFSKFAAEMRTSQWRRRKIADKIRNHAKHLHDLLANPPDFALDFDLWPLTSIRRDQLLAALREIHEEVGRALPPPTSAKTTWLIKELVPIYEAHFKQPVTRSRRDKEVTGPFVKFAGVVAGKLGTNISGHTVIAALKRSKSS